jgi:hypothetical protein
MNSSVEKLPRYVCERGAERGDYPRKNVEDRSSELVDRLLRLSDAHQAGLVPEISDALWLVSVLKQVLTGGHADAALGIKSGPGQRSWRARVTIRSRDQWLRKAALFLPARSNAGKAKQLHGAWSRYSETAWQRERVCEHCPERHRNTIYECLWQALKLHDSILSDRSLRVVLAVK